MARHRSTVRTRLRPDRSEHAAARCAPESVTGFRRFVLARAVAWIGNAMSTVAVPMLVYQLSGSPLLSGVAFAVESLPYLMFGLIAGALADRYDRRVVLLATQLGSALALASIPVAHLIASVTVAHLMIVAFAVSTLFVFFDAASFGVVPALVGRHRIADATGTLVSVGTVIGIVGPLLGGITATTLGPPGAIAIDALCFLVATVVTSTIALPVRAAPFSVGSGLGTSIGEGLAFIRHHRVVRALTAVGVGVSVANGVVVGLMVVVGVRQLGLAAEDARIGSLYAATAVGAFLISLVSARIQRVVGTGMITCLGVVVAFLSMLAWSITGVLAVSLLLLIVYQAANTMIVVNGIVVRQSVTPDHLQARVNTTARMIAMGGTPFGAAAGGAVAGTFGVTAAVVLGAGALALAGTAALWLGVPRLPLLAVLAESAERESQ
ncbi:MULTISPECIES: MFS transporter [unclassified Rhodococcus (in: high G+C Gram-positive bacteria)]|uniref:MFS transporter n=1 Tax=unclassified Rhodococcus (in: high G+C Gram-positive bacteria) TaxID=192944 RepID=UPI002795EBA8|nr:MULTISPECIES: MFS transporter [unclassified Rhodococcus (in: high G+C Gram-positive bacteria)]